MVLSQGIVISCCLICAVLFCSAAWDYILQYWAAFAPHVLPPLDRVLLHLSTYHLSHILIPVSMPHKTLRRKGLGVMEFCCSSILSA